MALIQKSITNVPVMAEISDISWKGVDYSSEAQFNLTIFIPFWVRYHGQLDDGWGLLLFFPMTLFSLCFFSFCLRKYKTRDHCFDLYLCGNFLTSWHRSPTTGTLHNYLEKIPAFYSQWWVHFIPRDHCFDLYLYCNFHRHIHGIRLRQRIPVIVFHFLIVCGSSVVARNKGESEERSEVTRPRASEYEWASLPSLDPVQSSRLFTMLIPFTPSLSISGLPPGTPSLSRDYIEFRAIGRRPE